MNSQGQFNSWFDEKYGTEDTVINRTLREVAWESWQAAREQEGGEAVAWVMRFKDEDGALYRSGGMSQYDDQFDDSQAICPYCLYSYQVECEDYSEDRREEECDECGKTYWIEQNFFLETTQTTPDCLLNGGKHEWELMTFRDGHSAFFCAICNECSLLAEDGTPLQEQSA